MNFSPKFSTYSLFRSLRMWLLFLFLSPVQFATGQEILVEPYLQPGNASDLRKEEKVLIWQTDDRPGKFKVQFAEGTSLKKGRGAKISFVNLNFDGRASKLYRTRLKGLKFDKSYTYRVTLNDTILSENSFKTRTRNPQTKFAIFGDVGAGTSAQAAIAYQVLLQEPQFVLIPGDMAYNNGRELEYRHRFFPYYLSSVASPEKGSPLLKTIPIYMLLGNHDVYSYDLEEFPDGLAYFYYSDLPRNAPVPKRVIEPVGSNDRIKEFKRNNSLRYPGISNYSFQNGNVHIIALDANYYVNPLDPELVEWIRSELGSSRAQWKIVSFHQPPFNASPTHQNFQIMRLLSPILEEMGVDVVLSGHEHNYQRSLPLKFEPALDDSGTAYVISEEGSVDGVFNLDRQYDGKTNTKASGIIYIITGAGGGELYDPNLTDNPALWHKEDLESWIPFTERLVSDRHSFTMIETNGKEMRLRQIDSEGNVFDEIKLTK